MVFSGAFIVASRVQDSIIHARGMLRDFRKAYKRHESQASVFLRLSEVQQHPKWMDHAILHGKPIGNCLIK